MANGINKYPRKERPKLSKRIATGIGKLAASKETKPAGVDWRAVAQRSESVRGSNQNRQEKGGTRLSFGDRKTPALTQAGQIRDLRALLFIGDNRFGLVLESNPRASLPDKFLLTELGEGQKSAVTLRETPLEHGTVAELNIGREIDNDVVVGDSIVSRKHAKIITTEGAFHLFDYGANGTTFLTARAAREPGADPVLGAAWDEMQAKPELWSGEFRGDTIVRAQL